MPEAGLRSARLEGSVGERTFLIADVRGYTRFTREHGDEAAARLARAFAELAHDAVEARGGRVVEIRGDEVLTVFASPAAAVRAATELIAACTEEAAGRPDLPLHAGVGIAAGEAVPVEGGFRGQALNLAARLCSRAAAGQVFVTADVAARAPEVDGIRYVEAGTSELKGFERPVELVEAVSEQRPLDERPAPAPAPVLPLELESDSPLAGRRNELAWLRGSWRGARRGSGRVLVVAGPAGSGKTRLAAEVAAFAVSHGANVRYVGAGGTAQADALAAIDAAPATPQPTLLVLDDLDVLGERVQSRLVERFGDVTYAPVLVVALARGPDANPAIAALAERANELGDGVRRLGPLDADAIRTLATEYAGDDVDEVPLDSIVRESGGLPGRLHELLSDWAEQEATRRLAAAAEWLASGRTQRTADLAFADSVIGRKLARLRDREAVPVDGAAPYKGLASFEAADAQLFFGRERLVGELAARTVGAGLLALVGASGSGKSSAIAAGLLPSLRAGLLPGSERWTQATMRPGERPAAVLDAALADRDSDGRLVLVVDQFEEVFTLCRDDGERAGFVERLASLAQDPERAVVLISVRGDFYGQCGTYPELARLLAANQVLVGPMSAEELRRAIELPARRFGARVESALAERLVAEVVGEPGGLPLLSTALVELWLARGDGWLRLDDHERLGGVRGAVARLAESTYEELDEEQRQSCRTLFMRLVATGERETPVRRRVGFAELELDRDPVRAAVVERLTADRLLTASDDAVEVSHEALLREWPRLAEWLAEDAQGRELREHVTQAAARWQASGREPSELYRGARLSAALDWSAPRQHELNELERDFLATSRLEAELEAERQRRVNRRLRGLLIGAAAFLVIAIAGGAFALVQRGRARHSATVALANSLGAQAVAEPRLDRAMLLGVEGVKLRDSDRTEGQLLTALVRAPTAIRSYQGDALRVNGLALSPDGRTLVIEDNIPNAITVDTATGRRVGRGRFRLPGPPAVYLTFAPDGKLVTADERGVRFVDPMTGKIVRTLPDGTEGVSSNFAFADRGHALAVVSGSGPSASVVQWRLPEGRRVGHRIRVPDAAYVAYAPGGNDLVVAGPDRTTVLDARTGRSRRVFSGAGGSVAAVSPDGKTVVTGDGDGNVRFLDLKTSAVATAASAHAGLVIQAGFAPDGRAITSGSDGKSRIWDVAEHRVVQTLAGHAGEVHGQAISSDGSTLYTGSFDTTALAWDLTGRRGFGRKFQAAQSDPNAYAPNVALSRDGRLVAVGATDGTVNVWNARLLRKVQSFRAGPGVVADASFSPDGRALLVAGNDLTKRPPTGYIGIWRIDGEMPRLLRKLEGGLPLYNWAAFSPDGAVVAAVGPSLDQLGGENASNGAKGDGLVAEWDAETGKLLARPTHVPGGGMTNDVSFAARGTTVAVSQWGNMAAVVDPARREILAHWKHSSSSYTVGVALSPDGKRVATSDFNGFVRVWDATSGKLVLPPIQASDNNLMTVDWSPDGSRLLVFGSDIRLYDAGTGRQIGASLPAEPTFFNYATFSPDGRTIAAADSGGNVWLYPATADGWQEAACRLANRNLSRTEWDTFVPGRPYRAVCPG